MNCRSCGVPLTAGTTFCTSCGAPTAYNTAEQSASPYASPVPTPPPYQSASPTPMAQTAYGAPSDPYGAPPPPQGAYNAPNPYNIPPAPEAAGAYGFPPAGQPPYGASGPNTPPPYGYGAPQGAPVGYAQAGQADTYGVAAPPKGKSKVGLIIASVIGGLILLCIISFVALAIIGKSVSSTAIKGTPSGNTIDPAAAAIISNAQTATGINQDTAEPTGITSTFTTHQKLYLIFSVRSHGQDGYMEVKWYQNNQLQSTSAVTPHHAQYDVAYFQHSYSTAGDAYAEVYWCTQMSCSDARLAQVAHFTITSTSLVPSHDGLVLSDADRRTV